MQGKPNDYRAMLKVGYYHQNGNGRGRESAIHRRDLPDLVGVLYLLSHHTGGQHVQ